MTHEHLIKWGKNAFERGFSLAHIENNLLERGLSKDEALKALHEITAFENKINKEAESVKKELVSIPIAILLIFSGIVFLYFAGIFRF